MGKVPKCIECEYHTYETTDHGRFGSQDGRQKFHWCRLHEIKDSNTFICGSNRFIKASESKTSPKWCPKREKDES